MSAIQHVSDSANYEIDGEKVLRVSGGTEKFLAKNRPRSYTLIKLSCMRCIMVRCQDVARLRTPLPTVCNQTEIGSVPLVNGSPSKAPQPDQLPFAHDPSANVLYFYSNGKWEAFGLSALTEVDLSNVTNLDDVLRIPVTYVSGNNKVTGYITLKDFKSL